MSKYITYTIEALENIKLAESNVQIDSEESMDYIPGSPVRGAFIYKYIMKNNNVDINTGEHRDKLLKGGIKFLNAYPMIDDVRSIPFPKCYFAPKQEIKAFDDRLNIEIGLDRKLDDGYEKVRISEFVLPSNDAYSMVKIKKIANLHINKKNEKNKLFRYTAIEKGQSFKGIIKIEKEEYIHEVFDLLSDVIVYIGGSKGSGYGKCRIYDMREEDINPEYDQFNDKYSFDKDIYLLALSDIIYRTDLGEYKTYIEPEFIARALNIHVEEFACSSIETKRITSFNNKWNCRTPQIVGIKVGSVFKYKINGEIDEGLLIKFMDKGIGERKADGFGRFVILDTLEDTCLCKDEPNRENSRDIHSIMNKMSEGEKEQISEIINKIYEQRVDSAINETVLKMYRSIKRPNDMERSQWGSYMAMFKSLYYEEPDKGKEKYKQYMEHLNKKRSKSYKQIRSLEYEDGKLFEALDKFISDSDDVNVFYSKNRAERIEIGNIKSSIDGGFAYRKNMKTLIELCRFHLRKGEDDNE